MPVRPLPGFGTNAAMPAEALPGNGLAQHPFLYYGEGNNTLPYVVNHGKVVWTYAFLARRTKLTMPGCFPTATSFAPR